MVERTLILAKPDGVQRGLVGEILKRFEQRGFKIVGMKMIWIDKDFAHKHYFNLGERRGEKVLRNMTKSLTSGPVVAVVLEGVDAVANVRKIVGATEPSSALPGTIRGDFTHHSFSYADSQDKAVSNIVHASGNIKEAEQEIDLWFKSEEIHSYSRSDEIFVF